MQRRVAITGYGMVCPCGHDTESSWKNIVAGKSGIKVLREDWQRDYPGLPVTIAGEVTGLDPRPLVESDEEAESLDKYILFALKSAQEAWEQAGLPEKLEGEAADRAGCIIGVGLAGYGKGLRTWERMLKEGPQAVDWQVIHNLTSNLSSAYVARKYGLKSLNYTTVSACTSGAHGVGEGFLAVREGRADVMIAGGVEAGVSPLTIAGFGAMRALSRSYSDEPEKASRPFEKNRDGFVLGEGGGVLVLEDMDHAKARGARILGEVLGYGATEDAHHITAPAEGGEGGQRAMQLALDMAGMKGTDVDYVNAHGTSTPLNDVNEAFAIRKVLGEEWADSGLMVSSTKSVTGHLLGGAGGIESVITAKAIVEQMVPPTINHDEPDPEIQLDVVPNEARKAPIRAALSNAFGFGGTNGSLLFGRYDA